MHFHSVAFFLFLGVVLPLWRWLPWSAGRVVLLVASYVFYGAAEPWYCLLLVGSTLVDYAVALRLGATDDPRARKLLVSLSVLANIGVLALFKYTDFVLREWHDLFGEAGGVAPALGWVLPVGISFYTFQTLSYTLDVYRRQQQPTRDFVGFALYVSFFPQLVAGPIERAGRLLPQLQAKGTPTRADVELGFQRILWGLTKKLVFADRLGLMVQDVYAAPAGHSSLVLLAATLAFTFQLYLDFSAYTDIAIGTARMIGVRLSENFRWPFLSRNTSEFWNRWHISLAHWFRDYVYQPLGGTRRGRPLASLLRLVVTLSLVGLWHGASWNFLAFGFVGGLLTASYVGLRLWRTSRGRRGPLLGDHWWSTPVAVLLTFGCILLEMVFFGTPDLPSAFAVIGGVFGGDWRWNHAYDVYAVLIALLVAAHVWRGTRHTERIEIGLAAPVRAAFWMGMVALITFATPEVAAPFIYFRF